MFRHIKIQNLDDYFQKLSARGQPGVYFYRISGYSGEIAGFIRTYFETARKNGVILEGKLQNPDENSLSYYEETMGMDFKLDRQFIAQSLQKWLPRMDSRQSSNVAQALYCSLDGLRQAGKTGPMIKNAYIKFMCWMYYKFERIVNRLGAEDIPKILYEGEISSYGLMLLSVLSQAGCDIALLQHKTGIGCQEASGIPELTGELGLLGIGPFPQGFCLKKVREEMQEETDRQRMYGTPPERVNCTNAWISGDGLLDVKRSIPSRGSSPQFFYNCFIRIIGVQDKATYANELFQFQLELKNNGRQPVIVDRGIKRPETEEIAAIRRGQYTKMGELIMGLSSNIQYASNIELQRMMVKAFVDVMFMEADAGIGINKLMNKAVYALCWLRRYQEGLFHNWKSPDIACFIDMGGCKDENEAFFLKLLARMPVDVLILCPQPNKACCLTDSLLYEIHYGSVLDIQAFPQENAGMQIGTAAYHAERELDGLMYQDSGIYRNQQYGKANALILQTMYEEIKILWDEETKYRPNFSTVDGVVNIPVIFAKVSGVKDGLVPQYWRLVKELITEDTFVIKKAPFLEPAAPNPMKAYAAGFYKNGRLLKQKIKEHPNYPYGYLREGVQDYILDKLENLIEQKIIKGTFENGTEYAVIALVLNLPKEIVRLLQKFDFTKKNPKLIYIHTTEALISLEDAILSAFLSFAGFDVVFFVPTGYQNVEKHFNRALLEEHQIGEYVYDLRVPNLDGFPFQPHARWRDKIFKRGR